MPTDATLTAKQARFVQEYLVDGNGAGAAVRAGYGVAGARVAACRALANDNVQKALQARQSADATRLSIKRDDVLAGLLEAVSEARELRNPAAMIAGCREIGKMLGFYQPAQIKVDLDGGSQTESRLSRMTDDELLKIIEAGAPS
jgi:hypothetical protein